LAPTTGLDAAEVGKIVRQHPSLLNYSIDTNLEPQFDWLQQRLDLDDDEVRKMVKRFPSLSNYNIDTKLEPKLDWLQQRLVMDDDEVRKMVKRLPSLFCYNIDTNLEPALSFYINALDSEEGALALVMQYPSLFGYSLEKGLKPRLEQVKEAGIVIDAGCLSRIAQYTNDQWHTSLLPSMKGKYGCMDLVHDTRVNILDAKQ